MSALVYSLTYDFKYQNHFLDIVYYVGCGQTSPVAVAVFYTLKITDPPTPPTIIRTDHVCIKTLYTYSQVPGLILTWGGNATIKDFNVLRNNQPITPAVTSQYYPCNQLPSVFSSLQPCTTSSSSTSTRQLDLTSNNAWWVWLIIVIIILLIIYFLYQQQKKIEIY